MLPRLPKPVICAKLGLTVFTGTSMAQPDYESLIDAPTWAFIRATEAAYPADAARASIAEQRVFYDRMCALFARGHPPGVTAQDLTVAGVPCRRYPGAAPVVLYLHGGGFVVGGLHSHDDVCADICAATGLTVLAVDYRLSPEHLHPAALDDVLAVIRAMPGPLVLAGDSAGGNLAAAAAQVLRDPRLVGLVLVYPGLGGDRTGGSHVTHAQAPMLTAADVDFYAGIRHGGAEPRGDPTIAPLQDDDFSRLPPCFALAAECDPLADDAHAYAARLRQAGGRAWSETAPGLPHGFLRARATVPRAAAAFQRITRAIAAFAAGQDMPGA